jgi:hypothetical protein
MNYDKYPLIILMKVGPYCGLNLDEIIDIKQKEEKKLGKYFWGYSGVFCRPLVVRNLVSKSEGKAIKILFVETESAFVPDDLERFKSYSTDLSKWNTLSKEILLLGSKKASHFAITGKNLKKVNFKLDLSQYCTLKGVFPNEDQRFDKYFKYRVDKACGIYLPKKDLQKDEVKIKYESDLVEPYVVHIR